MPIVIEGAKEIIMMTAVATIMSGEHAEDSEELEEATIEVQSNKRITFIPGIEVNILAVGRHQTDDD